MPISEATKDSDYDEWEKALQHYKDQRSKYSAAKPGYNLIKDLWNARFKDALKDIAQIIGQTDAKDFCDQMIGFMEMGWSEKQAYEQYCMDNNI